MKLLLLLRSIFWSWPKENVNGICRSVVEVLVPAIFTFGPLAVISAPIFYNKDELNHPGFISTFSGHWDSGEIIIPVLGLCGSMFALVCMNFFKYGSFFGFVTIILAAAVTFIGGITLGGNGGFSSPLTWLQIKFWLAVYCIGLFWWFALAVRNNTASANLRDTRGNVKKLLQEKTKRQAVSGSNR